MRTQRHTCVGRAEPIPCKNQVRGHRSWADINRGMILLCAGERHHAKRSRADGSTVPAGRLGPALPQAILPASVRQQKLARRPGAVVRLIERRCYGCQSCFIHDLQRKLGGETLSSPFSSPSLWLTSTESRPPTENETALLRLSTRSWQSGTVTNRGTALRGQATMRLDRSLALTARQ